MSKKIRTCELETPFEKISTGWDEYPRPQFRRKSYISLCGQWELSVLKDNKETPLGEITVPFPPESRISGIKRPPEKGEQYIYRRKFMLPENFNKGHVLLHFGAVDQFAEVFVNGTPAGGHNGGYLPFSFEVTEQINYGENLIEVKITDKLDTDYPYGKQSRKRGGMWYTPISGIWQAVWLESMADDYIVSLKLTPSLDSITIEAVGGKEEKTVVIHTENGDIVHSWSGDTATIKIPDPKLWSPENPYLYYFTLTDGCDETESYFALRTIDIQDKNGKAYICLNGSPYFFHGLLDQGYYSDGIYTPASPEGYLWDIKKMKSLGFNMLRKHIKIEPDLFYYYCDKYGMIVFQDMVNSGKYNFLIDTALPTIGLRRGIKHHASRRRRYLFEKCAEKTVRQLYNHPCVCYYTIFNEGWGQYDADRIYREMKALDPSRIWDATSGWFSEKESDVQSEHIYFKPVRLKAKQNRPLVLSEFGGYSCKIDNHSFNLDKNYGYKSFSSPEALTDGLKKLYEEEIIPATDDGLCAAVLTQVSDVEDETNGLVTYDRQVVKVDEGVMREISEKLRAAFRNKTGI
ncbi:MAG: glycoside hydrolase family 2 [Ruminiclostridium sp.]|nr:glycoside hydrolase family 2 [Ruminiclostridium sp.]